MMEKIGTKTKKPRKTRTKVKEKITIDFGGISKSTIDWHNKSSCTVLFNKCPFRCITCGNKNLLENTNIVDINIVKDKIEEFKNIDAVLFSGGEPTMQGAALEELARFSKRNDLYVGLETTGYYPETLKRIIEKGILDKVFLSIKASPLDKNKYKEITGVEDANKRVIESYKILDLLYFKGYVQIEMITTFSRSTIDNILEIAKFLEQSDYRFVYKVRQEIPDIVEENIDMMDKRPFNESEIKKIIDKAIDLTGIKILI